MKIAIYIRVSTDEQAKEGFSIRAQRNMLVDYCRVNDYEVTNVYLDDGYSAKDTKRPKLQQLLNDAKKGEFNAVLVYKLDRFTRSVRDLYELLEYLQRHSVDFISRQEKFDTTTAIGRAMIGILGVFAQFERELIAERVRLGMEQKTREGKRAGGRHPYGYDNDGQLIEEEATIIRLVRDIYMSGKSYQSVAAELHRKGYTRRNAEWTSTNVALTLENIFYAGIIRFGSKLPNGKYPFRNRDLHVPVLDVPGSHEPIWTTEEYEAHIARMRRRSNGGNGKKTDYWFNGVLRCGRCGSAMYGRLSTSRVAENGDRLRIPYYWCSKRKSNKGCDMPMFRQMHVERLIMQHISDIKADRERVIKNKSELSKERLNQTKEMERLKRELSKINARTKKWQYAFAEDLISADDLKQRMAEETEEEQELSKKLERLVIAQAPVEAYDEVIELLDMWNELDDLEKNEAITTIFKTLTLRSDYVYSPTTRHKRNEFFPATIEVEYN